MVANNIFHWRYITVLVARILSYAIAQARDGRAKLYYDIFKRRLRSMNNVGLTTIKKRILKNVPRKLHQACMLTVWHFRNFIV